MNHLFHACTPLPPSPVLSAVPLQLLPVTCCPSPGGLSPLQGLMHLGVSLLAVEWSCSPTFSPLLGEAVIDKLKDLHFTIKGLVSVSAGVPTAGRAQQGEPTAGKSHRP